MILLKDQILQSLILGVLSIYIGSIFKESKKRPLYIIDKTFGFEETSENK